MKELFIISKTNCDNEYAEKPALVVISLNKEYVQSLLTKIELAKKLYAEDNQFFSMEYFDYSSEWYKSTDKFEETVDLSSEYTIVDSLPDDLDEEEDQERMDVPTIIVTKGGVKFQAVMKYANEYISTEEISEDEFKDILKHLEE